MNDVPAEGDYSPIGFLKWASRIAPSQTRFVVTGVLVFAGAALVLGWTRNFDLVLTFAVALLILVFGLVALTISAASRKLGEVGNFLAWAISILFVAFLVLLLSSAFFGVPRAGAVLLARITGLTVFLTDSSPPTRPFVVAEGSKLDFGALPTAFRNEPASQDPVTRVQELADFPELVIRGTLQMQMGEKRTLAASTLRLDGGVLLTNGGNLSIEVNNLISDNGAIRSFSSPGTAQPGLAGRNGGSINITAHARISGSLMVDLRGEQGADGKAGADGGKGSTGAQGDNAASGTFDCSHGPGAGGRGGTGQKGGDGEQGKPGGSGGHLIVFASELDAARRVLASPLLEGGTGGTGGSAGNGGPGGDGGAGGSSNGWCQGTGSTGPQGDPGPGGAPGQNGTAGDPGSVNFKEIAAR